MTGDRLHDKDPHETARENNDSAWHRIRRSVLRVPSWVWAIPCAALAGLYAVVWPSSAAPTDTRSLTFFILRWGHSTTWVLLALSFLIRSSPSPRSRTIATPVAGAALLIYVLFLFTAASGDAD